MDPIDEDADAEVAEEFEEEEEDDMRDAEGSSEADAEGSEVDEEVANNEDENDDDDEEDDEGGEVVGAVKTRSTRSRGKRRVEESDSEVEQQEEAESDDDDDSSNAGVEEDWEANDEGGEDLEVGNTSGNRCIFCGQDEEHDPSEEFEEYLACSVCGDNSHRQCARDAGSLASDEDAIDWRCKDCVANGLEADFHNVPKILSSRRRSSAPKMARDLLPAARGGIKPDSHSVFNTLILDEDPMDGSRSLRKRKSPSDDTDEPPRPASRKRRRTDAEEPGGEIIATKDAGQDLGLDSAEDVGSRSGRPQRTLKIRQRKGAYIVSRTEEPQSCIIAIPITPAQWDDVERTVQRKQRRRERDRLRRARNSRRTVTAEPDDVQHFPAVQTTIYNNPFYAFPDRETDETKGKPYGGILTDAEADTSRTYPGEADRKAFQDARNQAEQQWKEKLARVNGETPARVKSSGPPSKIKCINFGQYEIDTWHAAPYPEEYSRNKNLYICEFCLKYMSSDYVAWRHKLKCPAKCPPGDEIYRDNITNPETGAETTLSFFEVDGRRNPLYCQNLCLLAKLFLGSKTLYYDVEPFLFYIMTENDEFGCHFVGYFSKEKRGCGPLPPPENPRASFDGAQDGQVNGEGEGNTVAFDPVLSNPGNNVSCILVLPVHMRRGFGRVLIEFSYLLTQVEKRTGSPEKPLSDMGLVSYRSYWRNVLCGLLLRCKDKEVAMSDEGSLSIAQIARETGMTPDDIISTLEALRFLIRDPITHSYGLRLDYDYMREYVEKHEKKATIKINPKRLCWTPYVMGRPTNFFTMGEEANQPMQTVAPREDGDPVDAHEDHGAERTKKEPDEAVGDADGVGEAIESTEELQLNGNALEPHRKPLSPAAAPTPQPSFMEKTGHSPSHQSPQKTSNGTKHTTVSGSVSPMSCRSDSQATSSGRIPATRFEIFPPVPGMPTSKRRPGRPPRSGSRRSDYGTPVRRPNASRRRSPVETGTERSRRTRSKLGEVSILATDDQEDQEANENAIEDDEDGTVEDNMEYEEDDDEEIKYE
ncbi:Hypothetical protein R9X50_00308600 [Acrodontium crateriforme]|uniref:Histone acetyltransferase n=1 Tax=Acrodontium crateriforme TaxID=150365 RepID=A0AAQ3M3C7_9PEZI|nr:Hypothetical protein R9X50_00308600 [Acrodontium crateriforme]